MTNLTNDRAKEYLDRICRCYDYSLVLRKFCNWYEINIKSLKNENIYLKNKVCGVYTIALGFSLHTNTIYRDCLCSLLENDIIEYDMSSCERADINFPKSIEELEIHLAIKGV